MRGGEDEAHPLFVDALARGLRVLEAFRETPHALRLTDIAGATGLGIAAAQRAVHTLHALGYLERGQRDRSYRPSPRLLELGHAFLRADRLAEVAGPHLLDLQERVGETTNLMVLDGTEVVYLVRLPRREVRELPGFAGARLPAAQSASGWAMLALLPETEAAALLEASLRKVGHVPGEAGWDPAFEGVARSRGIGVAVRRRDAPGGAELVAAAALRVLETGRLAAVTMPVPEGRWTVEAVGAQLAPEVKDVASRIAAAANAR